MTIILIRCVCHQHSRRSYEAAKRRYSLKRDWFDHAVTAPDNPIQWELSDRKPSIGQSSNGSFATLQERRVTDSPRRQSQSTHPRDVDGSRLRRRSRNKVVNDRIPHQSVSGPVFGRAGSKTKSPILEQVKDKRCSAHYTGETRTSPRQHMLSLIKKKTTWDEAGRKKQKLK